MLKVLEPEVSIVVASHRKNHILDLINAFLELNNNTAEMIIVTDYLSFEIENKYPQINWAFINKKSIPAKRNFGIKLARADIIAFIDDDCVFSKGWLDAGLMYLKKHPELAGVEGKTIIESGNNNINAPVKEFKRLEKRGYRTNNIFYRKKILNEVGGFDERFEFQREDVDIAYSILSKGYKIGFCEEAIVYHKLRENEFYDLLKNCINRRFDPLLYKKHPYYYKRYIGSPFTPSIGLVLLLHILAIFSLFIFSFLPIWILFILAGFLLSFLLSIRRNSKGKNRFLRIFIDGLLFFVSPIIIESALIYGSIKFKKPLFY